MNTQAIEPKTWATLTARAALLRTDPAYGPVRLLVARIGLITQISGVADLEALLWVLSYELGLHTWLRAGTQRLPLDRPKRVRTVGGAGQTPRDLGYGQKTNPGR